MNILLVDDSKTVRYKLREILTQYAIGHNWGNFKMTEAVDGVEALKVIEGKEVDIVFLDWNMPNMNGDDVVREIRRNQEHNKLRIIMLTMEGSKESVTRMIKNGVNGYVLKPFKDEKIYQALDALRVNTSK